MISEKLQNAINEQITAECGLPTCICPCLSISLAKVLTALPIG